MLGTGGYSVPVKMADVIGYGSQGYAFYRQYAASL